MSELRSVRMAAIQATPVILDRPRRRPDLLGEPHAAGSAVSEPRKRVERELLAAAREEDGVKLGVLDNACQHTACDTPDKLQPRSFRKAQRVIERVLGSR